MIIPTYVLEEHNEAFYAWKYAIKQQVLAPTSNTLLHIDEHSDMSAPNLNISLHELNGDLRAVKTFAENELHIASFITPAIYHLIFNKVYWIKYRHAGKINVENKMYVRSYNGNGEKLMISELSRLEGVIGMDDHFLQEIKPFSYYKQHIADIPAMEQVALDIDLDYFSCVQNPLEEPLKIEITAAEYQKFKEDKYHRIRYFDFGKIGVEAEQGKFFYCLNSYKNRYVSPLLADEEQIKHRINEVIEVLRNRQIRPQIITICRSRFSGYTAQDQWEFIEDTLLEGLKNVFDLAIHSIRTL